MSNFIYKLNAMEKAGSDHSPARYDYGEKRRAVLEHVEELEAEIKELRTRLAAIEALGELRDTVKGKP